MLNTDRRSLIAGTAATAVAVAIPASAAPANRRAWEHALAKLQAADGEHEAYVANFFDPAHRAEQAFEEAHGVIQRLPDGSWNPGFWDARRKLEAEHGTAHMIPEHIGERADALGEAVGKAQQEVLETPAPDLAALRYKLDYLLGDDSTDSTPAWSADFVAQTLADIARLLPDAA